MDEKRNHILKLLEEGEIDAAEAARQLEELALYAAPEPVERGPATPDSPDFNRFKRFWRLPFIIAMGAAALCAIGLSSIYAAAQQITLGFVCVWSFFMLAVLAAALAYWSRLARWLHVRVREKNGRQIAISLPVPLRLAHWGIDIARGYVDDQAASQLDMVDTLLTTFRTEGSGKEPLVISVDDEDGDSVQVYIG